MTLVVDASVALKWLFPEELSDEAYRLLQSEEPLVAPDLIIAEVTNIAWKKLTRNEITYQQAHTIASGIRHNDIALVSATTLNERALEIASTLNHPVYDCLYIACAEETKTAVVTADRRLYRTATEGGFAGQVVLLSPRR